MRNLLGQVVQNRLPGVRVGAILSRRILDPEFANQIKNVQGTGLTIFQKQQLNSEIMSIPDFQTLSAVKANPSPDEIETLGLVDAFMGPLDTGEFEQLWGFHVNLPGQFFSCGVPQWIRDVEASGFGTINDPASKMLSFYNVPPLSSDPFSCPPQPDIPFPWLVAHPGPGIESIEGTPMWPPPLNPHARFWKIWLGNPLSEQFAAVPNMIAIERVLERYPFPEPFNRDYSFILARHIVPELRRFAQTPAPLNDTVIRIFLTTTVLEKYEAMAKALEEYLEEQADNERRRAIVNAIGIAAVGAVIGAGIVAASIGTTMSTVATKGLSQIGSFYSKQQQADFAQELESAALAMQSEQPGFSKEVKFTSDVLKFLSEEGGSLSQLSPDEQARIVSGGDGIGVLEIAGLGVGALILLYFAGAFE